MIAFLYRISCRQDHCTTLRQQPAFGQGLVPPQRYVCPTERKIGTTLYVLFFCEFNDFIKILVIVVVHGLVAAVRSEALGN